MSVKNAKGKNNDYNKTLSVLKISLLERLWDKCVCWIKIKRMHDVSTEICFENFLKFK